MVRWKITIGGVTDKYAASWVLPFITAKEAQGCDMASYHILLYTPFLLNSYRLDPGEAPLFAVDFPKPNHFRTDSQRGKLSLELGSDRINFTADYKYFPAGSST